MFYSALRPAARSYPPHTSTSTALYRSLHAPYHLHLTEIEIDVLVSLSVTLSGLIVLGQLNYCAYIQGTVQHVVRCQQTLCM